MPWCKVAGAEEGIQVRTPIILTAMAVGSWAAALAVEMTQAQHGSPAGKIAFVRSGRIWVMNPDGSDQKALTEDGADCAPAWSPNGRWIAFIRKGGGKERRGVWLTRPDGTGLRRLTTRPGRRLLWSPDSRRVTLWVPWVPEEHPDPEKIGDAAIKEFRIYSVTDGRPLGLVGWGRVWQWWSGWSPDGRWLAISARGTARCAAPARHPSKRTATVSEPEAVKRIWLVSADTSAVKAVGQGQSPSWLPDGKWIALSRDGYVWRVRADGNGLQRLTNKQVKRKAEWGRWEVEDPEPSWGGAQKLVRVGASPFAEVSLGYVDSFARGDVKGTGQPQLAAVATDNIGFEARIALLDSRNRVTWLESGEICMLWLKLGDFNRDGRVEIASDWGAGGSEGFGSFYVHVWDGKRFRNVHVATLSRRALSLRAKQVGRQDSPV